MKNLSSQRIGKTFKTNSGHCFKIIRYEDSNNVAIQFDCGNTQISRWSHITAGLVKYPNHKTNCSIGFIGFGKYSSVHNIDAYRCWDRMLARSYRTGYKGYEGCVVCDEWHNFQNFAEWYYKQPNHSNKDRNGKSYCLDKDIFGNGKLYSPDNCCFVPESLNKILTNTKFASGAYKAGNKFMVRTRLSGRVGTYEDKEKAEAVYKKTKIKDILTTCELESYNNLQVIELMVEKFK